MKSQRFERLTVDVETECSCDEQHGCKGNSSRKPAKEGANSRSRGQCCCPAVYPPVDPVRQFQYQADTHDISRKFGPSADVGHSKSSHLISARSRDRPAKNLSVTARIPRTCTLITVLFLRCDRTGNMAGGVTSR